MNEIAEYFSLLLILCGADMALFTTAQIKSYADA
jgi:hypothetical protein